ncbi:flagellar basal body-associated protein FliL [Mesobacillus foraminis]|uniref:Flagellar protein FliL n=1 Tax=Mesobacillus foraminis TaxID=279826 RepID=A0A4R2BGU4_9BACI|nr:flagellar basal body-associated protein FliL [Mesobacillus foraminis]MBT2756007.1 flagellar basal body-associated protein FliL [Mesobacillus foraminis]TCN25612.1 flagellar FliL protein [Mesobacillus foraminis]
MKNNKLVMSLVIMLGIVILAAAAAVFFLMRGQAEGGPKEPGIDEVLESSVDVEEITANLATDDYIRVSFKIQTDSKKAKEELEKRDFQTRNVIIYELSEKKAEDLQGKDGKLLLEDTIKDKLNGVMQEGKVVKVYITEALLQ